LIAFYFKRARLGIHLALSRSSTILQGVYMSKVVRSTILVLSMLVSCVGWAQEENGSSLSRDIQKLDEQSRDQLETELALLEIAIATIETTQFFDAYAGGLDRLNVWIAVPAVLFAGSESIIQGSRLADGLVRTMTPKKSQWFAEYTKLKADVKEARSAYRRSARLGAPDSQTLKMKLMESENALTSKLLRRPGKLYKFGRALRFLGRTSVVLAGVTLTAVTFNEAWMLALGRDNVNDIHKKFQARVLEIERLLHPGLDFTP
jgi:hypothetical protein